MNSIMADNKKHIDQIVGKMLGEEGIGEEREILDSWIKEAKDNAKALADMQEIAKVSDTLKGYQDFDTDQAWDDFNENIDAKEDNAIAPDAQTDKEPIPLQSDYQKNTNLYRWTKVAAAIVVLIGAVFLFSQDNLGINEASFVARKYQSEKTIEHIELADGSKITLDKNSSLLSSADREVTLNGRAFFDVEASPTETFEITLQQGEVTVLGTQFSIVTDDNTTEVYVKEGIVEYRLADRTWRLEQGDFVRVVDNTVTKIKNNNPNILSWQSQIISFRNNSMVEVIEALNKHFSTNISLEVPSEFRKCNVHTNFKDSTLEDILNELAITHGLKFEIRGEDYVVVDSKC